MFDLLLLMFLLIFVAPFFLPSEREVREEYRKLIGCDRRCAAAQTIVREQQPPVKKKLTKPVQAYTAEQKKEFYDKYGFNPEDMSELPYNSPKRD